MKGISILTGAVIALGLGGAPGAFANDDLDEVTMEMVFDEVDEIGGATLSLDELDEEELARDVRSEDESGRDGVSDDGNRDGREDGFSEDGRVADLTDEELGVEHDEALEGDLEDHDVEDLILDLHDRVPVATSDRTSWQGEIEGSRTELCLARFRLQASLPVCNQPL